MYYSVWIFIVIINSILWHLREIVKLNKSVLESVINQSLIENKRINQTSKIITQITET